MNDKLKKKIQRLLTPHKHIAKLHHLFKILLDVFKKYNIFTLAMSGTLLGIVRNHDYILWDDDIDLAVNFSDYDRIMNLNMILNPIGIEITDQGFPWESGKMWKVTKFRYVKNPSIFIDLFPFEFKGYTYRMAPKGSVPGNWYRRNVFKVNELYPLQLMKLRDLWVPCPNDPEGFVKRSYGEEALDTCIVTHQHLSPPESGVLKNFENSVEMFFGMGPYGKKFPCDLVDSDTPPLLPSTRLKWIHFVLFGVFFLVGVALIIFSYKKKR
jgi:hypothetical protein